MSRESTLAAVVINYNYETFVVRAVASVLHQTVPFDAVIVVDDGSADSSCDRLREAFPDVPVVVKPNGGQLSACFIGLDLVDCDYVYFLDSDDMAGPKLSERVRTQFSGDPFKVQFQLRAVDSNDVPTGSLFPTFPSTYVRADMYRDVEVSGGYLSPPTSGNVYRRETLLSLDRAVLDLRDSPDGPINMVAPYLGEVAVVREPLALYRLHGDSHSMWSKPSVDLLQHEVEWFVDRWMQAAALVGMNTPPTASFRNLYLVERQIMITCLEGRRPARSDVSTFVALTLKSRAALPVRAFNLIWAFMVVCSGRERRKALVIKRRSHAARGRVMRLALFLMHRFRASTAGRRER